MHPNEYQSLALRKEADQQVILDRLVKLGPQAMRLDNGARGLCNDAGEIGNVVKNHIEYGQVLDVGNLLEEVGDCLWRLAQICSAAGLTLEQAMQANLRKLQARYPDSYSDLHATNRNKEAEQRAMIEQSVLGKVAPLPRCMICGNPNCDNPGGKH